MDGGLQHIVGGARPKVLILDHPPRSPSPLASYLEDYELEVQCLDDPDRVDDVLNDAAFDLLVLAVKLKGADGLELCKRISASKPMPIVLIGEAGAETDRIIGLELGADSYIERPVNPRELVAQIRALLRRRLQTLHPLLDGVDYRFSGWRAGVFRHRVIDPDGRIISLSAREFRLLVAFLENPLRVLSRDRLLDLTHRLDEPPYDRVIDVMVSRLRRKLARPDEPDLIQTVRGEGYILDSIVFKG